MLRLHRLPLLLSVGASSILVERSETMSSAFRRGNLIGVLGPKSQQRAGSFFASKDPSRSTFSARHNPKSQPRRSWFFNERLDD